MVFGNTYRFTNCKHSAFYSVCQVPLFHGVLQESLYQSGMFFFYFCSLPLIPLFSVIPNATFAQMEGKNVFFYLYRRIRGGSGIMNHESIIVTKHVIIMLKT